MNEARLMRPSLQIGSTLPRPGPGRCPTPAGAALRPRQGEQHVAVRFGDSLRYRVFLQHPYYCPIEVDVSDYVNEAVADRERGWVNFVAGPPFTPNLLGRVTGAVRIESVPC